MNKGKKRKILEEVLDVCSDNTTAYKLRRTMNDIEHIIDNE